MLLTPEVGAWAPLWEAPALGPVVRAEYDVVISDGWGFVGVDPRVIVLRRVGAVDVEAFEVAPSSTTASLEAEPAARRLSGGPLAAFRPRLWFPGIDEFVVGDLQSRPLASELLAIPTGGVSAVPSMTWLRELPEDVSPSFGARLSGTAVNRVGAGGDMIVVAGGGVAFREAPSSTHSVIYVPTRVAVNIGDRRETYDVRHRLPPQPLPAGVTGIAVEAAPDYGGWWRPDHARVVLLDKASDTPDRTFESLGAGPAVEFQVPMEPGVRRELVLSTDGWPSIIPNELDPVQIQQVPPEPNVSPWWLLAALSIASLLTLLAVAVSADSYHLVLSRLGFRWKFAEEDAQVEVSVRGDGGSDAIFRNKGEAASRHVSVPPVSADFEQDRDRWKQSEAGDRVATVHVQADVDGALFRYDWHACFSEPWTGADSRIFAGLIYNSGRNGQAARQDAPRRGPMIVSVLAGGVGDRGLVPFMAHTAQLIEGSFKGPGFRVHAKHRDGTRAELQAYLKESDIVVVLAHAANGAWQFPGGAFSASDWREIAPSIRCRCMIILGCGLGDLLSSEDPLLLEVVRSGVTCVASMRSRQDAVLGNELVPAFCKIWRSGRTVGPTVAEALHNAAIGVATSRAGARSEVEEDLNAYVVIGTPTLRLEWRRVRAGAGA